MKKISFLTLAVLVFAVFSFQTASAQFPKVKIPKPSWPKPQPTPADTTQPAPGSNTQPAQPQPGNRNTTTPAVAGTTIDKPSIQLFLQTHRSYKGNRETWSWTPKIDFRVNGPITAGSQLAAEYSLPTNKSWLKFDCETAEIGPGSWWTAQDCGQNPPDEQAVTYTGMVDFKISLKNELEGKSATLLSGKFKVEKFRDALDLPNFQNNSVYYVNHDWNLPIGYIYEEDAARREKRDYQRPPPSEAHLMMSFWLKGDTTTFRATQAAAYLYYQGQLVADSKENQQAAKYGTAFCEILDRPDANTDSPNSYCRMLFGVNALVWDKNPTSSSFPRDFPMYKNPGEYEIKILQNGKLARTARFTMGPNSQLVDTGIASKNNLGTGRIVVPVRVIGDQDGIWDRNAYKTEAFFGNPLSGFVAP